MTKAEQLAKIARQIERCKQCKEAKTGKAVPGEGDPDATVMFLGEAPGRQEAKTGRPFIGRSGQLLRSLIRKIGFNEEDVYITSPVKYLPLRGTPTKKDIQHGKTHLQKQLDIINPKVIVLLGNTASFAMFERQIPITKEHGTFLSEGRRTYFLTFHPAAGLRFPPLKKKLEEDFELLRRKLKNSIK